MGDLIARLEATSGAGRELDCLIWADTLGIEIEWQGNCMVAGIEGVIGWIDPGVYQRNFTTNRSTTGPAAIPAYTSSIDAAMTLIPEGYGVMMDDLGKVPVALLVKRHVDPLAAHFDAGGFSKGATLPLALCIASLRARGLDDA